MQMVGVSYFQRELSLVSIYTFQPVELNAGERQVPDLSLESSTSVGVSQGQSGSAGLRCCTREKNLPVNVWYSILRENQWKLFKTISIRMEYAHHKRRKGNCPWEGRRWVRGTRGGGDRKWGRARNKTQMQYTHENVTRKPISLHDKLIKIK